MHPPRWPSTLAVLIVLGVLTAAIFAPSALAKPKETVQSEIQQTKGFRNAVTLAGVREHQAALQAIADRQRLGRASPARPAMTNQHSMSSTVRRPLVTR